MTIKQTRDHMEILLYEMIKDLYNADFGNMAAAQRVRVKSIQFSKIAKVFRKESLELLKMAKNKEEYQTMLLKNLRSKSC